MADDPDLDWITSELRAAAQTERAPTHLRLRLDAMTQSAGPARRPARVRHRRMTGRRALIPTVGLLAAVVIALGLVLSGGTPAGPTVAQAAAVGIQPLTYSPPPARAYRAVQTKRYARFAAVRFPRGLGSGTSRAGGSPAWTGAASSRCTTPTAMTRSPTQSPPPRSCRASAPASAASSWRGTR